MPPPSPAPQRLCVVSAANAAYFPGLAVTFYSLLRHLAPGWAVDFLLLTDGLEHRQASALEQVLRATGREHTLKIHELDLTEYADRPALFGSKLAYARLLLPELVGAERALYVDSDIVVTRDVSGLAALPWHENQVLCAVRDARITSFGTGWESVPCDALGIPPSAPYFNSGWLWINLAEWRRQGVGEACRAYMDRFPDCLRWHDQTTLNAVLWNRWSLLDSRWNVPPEHTLGRYEVYPFARTREVNVHYLGSAKPWSHMQPLEYFYRDEAEAIVKLVPDALALRRKSPWEIWLRLRYFVSRAGWQYVLRPLLKRLPT